MNTLSELVSQLRDSRGFQHKRDIGDIAAALAASLPGGLQDTAQAVALGDDCAAIPDGAGGYLLFAIEGMTEDFVAKMPWFAGYSGVMVNISDIAAMGGRPLAVVNALWSDGMDPAAEVIRGMAAASTAYGVPIVGGHSNNRSARGQLAVAVLGRAQKLLSSFNAQHGDVLMMAVDLRGRFEEPYPWWNASSHAPAKRLRDDLALLPQLAESGLCDAAKDISMAGCVGTAMMLLECSQVGACIDLDALPIPDGVPLTRWLTAFPSFGFVLSVRSEKVDAVRELFAARDIACAAIGEVLSGSRVVLTQGDEECLLWDFALDSFIGERRPEVRDAA
ncbi:sll0787 family AIR synthase-like protein [Uliginosibacterium sp. H1]|uniref:sll0787 family AIR synthase-like protein n=1 Tax=Uliginosibacterium sp. H1 TaxID=3114757 RepID=UPI002E19404D|nr:sll0787 family AIR synthase-like protein [Uliginosibacterium sp. H1]